MIRLRLTDPAADLAQAADGLSRPLRVLPLEEHPLTAEGLRALGDSDGVRILDVTERANDISEDFSRLYVDFIAQLSKKNASPDWWALSLVGRNPLSTRLPERCFALSLIRDAVAQAGESGSVLVLTSDTALAGQCLLWAASNGVSARSNVRTNASFGEILLSLLPIGPLYAFLRALARTLCVRALSRFRPDPETSYDIVATLLNHQSFGPDGLYHDTYFGDLPHRLHARGGRPLVFGAVTHDFFRTVRRCREQSGDFPLLPMETFMGLSALCRLWLKATAYQVRGFPVRGDQRFEGMAVDLLIRSEIAEHASRTRLFTDLQFRESMLALLRRVRPARLLFPFENRAWERMLMQALASETPGTPSIGYQHATTTPYHLNFQLGVGETDSLPLPDHIVTLGKVTLDRLKRAGFPPARLIEGAALRQAPLPDKPADSPPGAARILVALASSVEEYVQVLRLLDAAFGEDAPEIVLRPHPVISLEEALERTGKLSFPYLIDRGRPLGEAIESSDVLLFASGTLGLEAVRRGVPAVFLRVGRFLSTDPMSDFDGLKWSVRTPEGLHAALSEIGGLSEDGLLRRRRDAREYSLRYCRPATDAALAPLLSPVSHKNVTEGMRP